MNAAETLTAALLARAAQTGQAPAYRWQDPGHGWRTLSWQSFADDVRDHSAHLLRMGLQAGDRVVLMLGNTPQWECLHHAVMACGGVVVGIDAHDSDANLRHLLDMTRPRGVVCDDERQLLRLSALWPQAPAIQLVAQSGASVATTLASLQGVRLPTPAGWPLARPDALATIVFTSGTTGAPKGVAYTHRQVCFAARQILQCVGNPEGQTRLCCWLPLSNMFQRMNNFCALLQGAETWFVRAPTELMALVTEINPTLLIGVPRFYEKLHDGLQAAVRRKPWWARALVRHAWAIGERHQRAERAGRRPSCATRLLHPLAEHWVLRRLRAVLGTQCRHLFSGSAALPAWLIERLEGLGWRVLEAYGTSESVLPIAMNTPQACRPGSVGRPLPGNEVTLAPDGEILVRGPGVCGRYFMAEPGGAHETQVDGAGYLHTGDIGRIDSDGFVWITGRKSEIFKTATGRRIAPAPLEASLKRLPYVNDAVVCGRNRPFAVAMLSVTAPPPHEQVQADMAAACQPWPQWQRPAGALLIRTPFGVETGELTSNLKVRRQHLEARHAPALDRLYRSIQQGRGAAAVAEASA